MTSALDMIRTTLRLLPRTLAFVLALSAPVLAVTSLQAGQETIIEAPTMKNMGAGFVLLVSLQRG
jgi:hypothetical protein